MITTGTPVTIALFEWLTWFASQHPEWFDQSSDTHLKINQILESKSTIDTDDVKSFFTFLCGFLLLFDGDYFHQIWFLFQKEIKVFRCVGQRICLMKFLILVGIVQPEWPWIIYANAPLGMVL